MHPLIQILMAIAFIGVVIALAVWLKPNRSAIAGGASMILFNIGEGTHGDQYGGISLLPDAALSTRFLVAKVGATPGTTAAICTSTDIPLGIFQDQTLAVGGADDLTMPVAIRLFGSATETRKVAINSTVSYGDWLIVDSANPGFAKTDPATASTTVWVIGRALLAGAAGDTIEMDPFLRQVTH